MNHIAEQENVDTCCCGNFLLSKYGSHKENKIYEEETLKES